MNSVLLRTTMILLGSVGMAFAQSCPHGFTAHCNLCTPPNAAPNVTWHLVPRGSGGASNYSGPGAALVNAVNQLQRALADARQRQSTADIQRLEQQLRQEEARLQRYQSSLQGAGQTAALPAQAPQGPAALAGLSSQDQDVFKSMLANGSTSSGGTDSSQPPSVPATLPTIDLGFGTLESGSDGRREPVKVDRKGFVEETILDPEYRAQVEAESRAAQETWVREENAKNDLFKELHFQKLKEWRERLPWGESNFDNHPDVKAIEALTRVDGVLLSPDELKRNDNALVDQGWFPYAKIGDHKYSRNDRTRFQQLVPIPGLEEELKLRFPDQKPKLMIPEFRRVRDWLLKDVPEAATEEKNETGAKKGAGKK